jgi:hypothetical protein
MQEKKLLTRLGSIGSRNSNHWKTADLEAAVGSHEPISPWFGKDDDPLFRGHSQLPSNTGRMAHMVTWKQSFGWSTEDPDPTRVLSRSFRTKDPSYPETGSGQLANFRCTVHAKKLRIWPDPDAYHCMKHSYGTIFFQTLGTKNKNFQCHVLSKVSFYPTEY